MKEKSLRNLLIVHLHVEDRKTLTAIGEQVGLSRERVRQIIRAAGIDKSVTRSIVSEIDKHRYIDITCEYCGLTVKRAARKVRAGRFCSRRCSNAHCTLSSEELLSQLRKLALMLGHTPRMTDFGAPYPSHHAYYTRFGSLMSAQKLAGLTPNPRGGRTHHRLPAGFRDQWEHLLEAVVV